MPRYSIYYRDSDARHGREESSCIEAHSMQDAIAEFNASTACGGGMEVLTIEYDVDNNVHAVECQGVEVVVSAFDQGGGRFEFRLSVQATVDHTTLAQQKHSDRASLVVWAESNLPSLLFASGQQGVPSVNVSTQVARVVHAVRVTPAK